MLSISDINEEIVLIKRVINCETKRQAEPKQYHMHVKKISWKSVIKELEKKSHI